jgi:hypothetical protein
MWLDSLWAMVRVANGCRVDSWRLWCRVAAGVVEVVERIGFDWRLGVSLHLGGVIG